MKPVSDGVNGYRRQVWRLTRTVRGRTMAVGMYSSHAAALKAYRDLVVIIGGAIELRTDNIYVET